MRTTEYRKMKNRQVEELKEFARKHCFYAFEKDRYKENMEAMGLDPEADNDTAILAGGMYYCCFTQKEEDALRDLVRRQRAEVLAGIDGDPTGEGFIYQMFLEEMTDNKFQYTGDLMETLEALDLTLEEVTQSAKLFAGMIKAGAQLGQARLDELLAAEPASDAKVWYAISMLRDVYQEDPQALEDIAEKIESVFSDMDPDRRDAITRAILSAVISPEEAYRRNMEQIE